MLSEGLPELLAPAGNGDCLKAAAAMGADAVYLAGKSFGARNYADNFDDDELREWVRYARLRGVRVHVAVNTLVGDREIPALKEYLRFLEKIGVDALIIQDLAVLSIAKELELNLELHGSTQLTVHNLKGAEAARELGFSRVVLARELPFDEIKHISGNCGIETEIFVHGAMCMSYSGQCLMSSALGGRSGNRGRCAQPCRLPYTVGGREKFCLSLKDMSLIEHIDRVIESGAASLKIEGRMKGPAYVGSVVKAYRDCLDQRRQPTKREIDLLNSVFYRGGQTAGYFTGNIGASMFTFSKPDNPYLKNSENACREILDEVGSRAREFSVEAEAWMRFAVGERIRLELRSGELQAVTESLEPVEPARLKPLSGEKIKNQIAKTGDSVFRLVNINVEIEGEGFAPLSEINDLRRRALSSLEEQLAARGRVEQKPLPKFNAVSAEYSGFTATVTNVEQFLAVKSFERAENTRFELVGVPISLLEEKIFDGDRERIVIEPPSIMFSEEYARYEERLKELKARGFNKLRVHNISELGRHEEFILFGSQRLNIANSISMSAAYENLGLSSVMASAELSLPQIRDMVNNSPVTTEVCAYGYQPLMITENCIIKNTEGCPCKGVGYLTDRRGVKFPIIREDGSCRTVLLNSRPTFTADKLDSIKAVGAKLINLRFTVETPNETDRICKAYLCGSGYKPREFTRLHFNKGIFKETD